MEEIVEDILRRDKYGFFYCKTCDKRFFVRTIFVKHLKNEHSLNFKIENVKEEKKDPNTYQDCNLQQISGNQISAALVKSEVTSNTTDTMDDTSSNNSSGSIFKDHRKMSFHKCPECPRLYLRRKFLQKHIENTCNKLKGPKLRTQLPRTHKCRHCKETFISKVDLKAHQGAAHATAKKLPQCPECQRLFSRRSVLKRHIENNCNKLKGLKLRTGKCKHCKETFISEVDLKAHQDTVHETIKPHRCKDCGKYFDIVGRLQSHVLRFHSKIMTLTCKECTESYSDNFQLKKHIYSVHKHLRPHHCKLCDKFFKYNTEIKQHISVVHEKLKQHQCLQCKRSFGKKLNLQTHIKGVHKKLKPFQCQECQGKFGKKQALTKHIAIAKCQKVEPLKLYKIILKNER